MDSLILRRPRSFAAPSLFSLSQRERSEGAANDLGRLRIRITHGQLVAAGQGNG